MNFIACKARFFALLSFFLLVLSTAAVQAAEPSKTIVVLIDVSASTGEPAIRKRYSSDFAKIIKSLKPGDAVAVDRIAESSAAGSTLPVNEELQGGWDKNPIMLKKANREILARVEAGGESIFSSNQHAKYTDILSSLYIAERVFKAYNKERNILVIMSDMIEDSKSYNFEKEKLTAKRIGEIIAKEKKAGHLPDLQKARIYAVKNATGQLSGAHVDIQNFWLRFLPETGAVIDKSQYGPLIKFE